MESINPIFWILGTLLAYFSIWLFLLLIIDGAMNRKPAVIIAPLIAASIALYAGKFVSTELSAKFIITTSSASIMMVLIYLLGLSGIKDWKKIKQRKVTARHIIIHLVLATGAFIFITPFGWLVTTSFKEEADIFKYPPSIIPMIQVRVDIDGKKCGLDTMVIDGSTVQVAEFGDTEDGRKQVRRYTESGVMGDIILAEKSQLTRVVKPGLRWQNFPDALNTVPPQTHKGLLYLWNTVYITVLSIIGTLFSSSLVAYSFARLKWPGKDIVFAMVLATMMIPGAVTLIPVFLVWRILHGVDTLRPLWVQAFFAGAFPVFLLRQFFMTIPRDLEDAAKIDGCSYFGIYWRIMLPLIKPALATLTIMTFMGTWNNFMGPLIYISTPEKMPLAYGLQLFSTEAGVEYGMLMAGSTMVMLPVLLIFFFTQRYFIQGITLTGIKG